MDCFIIRVGIRLGRQLWSNWYIRYRIVFAAAAATAEVSIEDIEGIGETEENMVTVEVEVVEETGSQDGNSSIHETTT